MKKILLILTISLSFTFNSFSQDLSQPKGGGTLDIVLIKSLPTSQGSKVYYFNTRNGDNFLIPQRLENFDKFLFIIKSNTKLNIGEISYISPLWTYELLTYLSVMMIIGEFFAFIV